MAKAPYGFLVGSIPARKTSSRVPKKIPRNFFGAFFCSQKNRRPLTRIFLSGYNAPKEIVRAKILPFGNSQFQFFGNGIQAIPFSGPNFRSPQNELAVVPRPLCSKQVPRTDFEQTQKPRGPTKGALIYHLQRWYSASGGTSFSRPWARFSTCVSVANFWQREKRGSAHY